MTEHEELMARYHRMYASAFVIYIEDCRAALHSRRSAAIGAAPEECIEALDDLLGPQVQLSHLCSMLGIDVTEAANAVMAEIETDAPRKAKGEGRREPMALRA